MNLQPEPASLSQDWNLNTRKHISLEIHGTYVVTCLILDVPRDIIITASDDHTIAVYTLSTGQLRSTLVGHEGGIWSLSSIYYDGQHLLISGSTDKTVRIWDLVSGKCLHVFRGHSGTVRCLDVVSPAMEESSVKEKELSDKLPLIATGSRDKSVKVWSIPGKDKTSFIADEVCAATTERDADASSNPYHLHNLTGHTEPIHSISAHGRTAVSGSYDHSVRVWDIVSGVCKHVLNGHSDKVYVVVYDPTRDQVYSTGLDGTINIYSATSGVRLHTLTGHMSLVGLLELSSSDPSPYLVSGCADATLKVWDPITGALIHTLDDHPSPITSFHHDGKRLVGGGDSLLRMWDIRTGTAVKDLLRDTLSLWKVAFDGQWAVCAYSKKSGQSMLDIWNFGTSDSKL
ncbi:WD40-repeat-containing domain protein [Lentinula edodes]|uniref:WD40-repeat-containing domain protein n=1 Tax=Lentinula edodes TaxID=5353 RepID=UPI001E8D519D|nr:WD40-repeat-containing domain protein [Lentinula edodes]KAH7874818.1 WD40-repeat-containing domain protein [Lentinula edodes]